MSYNYLLNAFDGSIGCRIANSEFANSSPVYNGKVDNQASQSSGPARQTGNYKSQGRQNSSQEGTNTSLAPEAHIEDKRLRISEKLKVLLKNGGSRHDESESPDPYAFSEGDLHYSGTLNRALNNVDTQPVGRPASNVIAANGNLHKSIMYSGPTSPHQAMKSDSANGKDCNGDTAKSLKRNLKLAKFAVPLYGSNTAMPANANPSGLGLQPNDHLENGKMSGVKSEKTLSQSQLPYRSKPLLSKLVNTKAKLQGARQQTNATAGLKSNMTALSKPAGFGPAQVSRVTNSKAEKKFNNGAKSKHFQKGKSLLNQLQKTAFLNRPGIHQIRKNPNKTNFFGTNKSLQKPAEAPDSTLQSKNATKKSLLEESLLGLKTHGSDADAAKSAAFKHKPTSQPDPMKVEADCTFDNSNGPVSRSTARLSTESLLEQGKNESLERIWTIRNKLKGLKRDHHHFGLTINDGDYDDNSNSECMLFQNYWFSVCGDYDSASNADRKRDLKLSQLKVELRHKIKQLQWRYKDDYRDKVVELLVDSARKQPNLTAFLIRLENSKFNKRKKISRVKPFNLLKPVLCTYADLESGQRCREPAMPCIKYCQQHITCSNDQLLFTSCSALRSDNTTCRAAVLNQSAENPLCFQHKRLVNMSEIPKKLTSPKPVSRPSQPRKRSRSSTGGSTRSGRNRKRKRSGQKDKKEMTNGHYEPSGNSNGSSVNYNFGKDFSSNGSFRQQTPDKISPQVISRCDMDESQEVEVSEEVLAIAADLPLELASQATKLLEEHDFTNVLNHIPADAFNDLFTEDKEEYEPTPQETEELERALEAVDKDVKSLEKLSQTQGILDTLLDEQTIAQTLAQLPEVTANIEVPQTLVPVFYQNGFSNINQLEQTLHDVNKSLTQTVLLNQTGTETMANHFNNFTIPNHADVLQS